MAPVWLAYCETIILLMLNNAWSNHFTSGLDDTANSTLWSDLIPLSASRINAFEVVTVESFPCLIEIPPGNPVHRCQDGSVAVEQRCELARTGMRLVCF